METKQQLAKALYQIGALQVNDVTPFKWTSGILSPIYCDNRLTMSEVSLRNQIADQFATYIKKNYPDVDVIAGCATAGIPHAAWVADKLALPMVYVRDKAKGHGKQNQIEGSVQKGQKAIVVEDLISTGKSSLNSVRALQAAGVEVVEVVAIFSYELAESEEAFAEAKVKYHALTNFVELLHFMKEEGTLSEEQVEHLLTFKQDPRTFSTHFSSSND
ncbi:orotate phosphoribosyltransferase [Pontibacillus litoralis]|uniref:Orotate phosphoribosyltransferase n=1 Tax=Pontibacillus litoralis JSM 072002 TaxID=1385512 RepID=A0A0A5GBP9_9BACI|nr:orotate phosphoribosyltransferase [Pontibacillus litoralis]KGX88510.1 orotate phosphoribosyltransferase [Pontibacillus litoralis JSM 072002]